MVGRACFEIAPLPILAISISQGASLRSSVLIHCEAVIRLQRFAWP